MSVLSERPDGLVGSILGKVYRVLEPIGAGGMAVVYLVEHQTLLKRFAAKVLSNHLASSLEARARFMQEAHAASQLDHENIVSITDFGAAVDGRPFFVMELLRGQTLDERLSEGSMTLEEVVAVCVPVARALAHAHAEGIVHLDVKPENIFLTQRRQGRWGVKVVDFGIAKTPQNPRLTKVGETAGSPMFMAPEVCRGDEDVDQRADVYSFGILLYLMMCGRLPFVHDNANRVLQMQLVELPAPPREVNDALSPELAIVVERALAKDPNDRYPSMNALLHDLAAALPPGADRLLIEAQSGASVQHTPFPAALSLPRPDSQPPVPLSESQVAAAPKVPMAPSRLRVSLVIATVAVVTAVIGVAAWRRFAPPPAGARSHGTAAQTTVTASADGTAPQPGVKPTDTAAGAQPAHETAGPQPTDVVAVAPPGNETAPPAAPAVAAPEAAPAGDHNAAGAPTEAAAPVAVTPPAAAHATLERAPAILKRPAVRPKAVMRPGIRPLPQRPGRRPAVAPGATPIAAPPAGADAAAVPPVDLGPSSDAPAATPSPSPSSPPPSAAPPAPPPPTATPAAPPAPVPVVVAPIKPVPAVPARPAPAPVGALDATPSVTSLEVKGSLSPSIVRRSVERTLSSMRACYRAAARAAGATPAVELKLSFEIDENSLATQVSASGASFGSLATCAAGVARQIRTQQAPDVGTAQVTAVIRFRPS